MLAVREGPTRNELDRHCLVSTASPAPEPPAAGTPPPEPAGDDGILLRVRGLKKYFPVKQGFLKRTTGQLQAVDGVDLDVPMTRRDRRPRRRIGLRQVDPRPHPSSGSLEPHRG